jgi:predicted DNA-binding protein
MVTIRSSKPQLSLVLSNGLKQTLKKASDRLDCSQAEIVRTALYEYLKDLSLLSEQVKEVGSDGR